MENDRIAKRVFFENVLVVAQWVGRGRGGLIRNDEGIREFSLNVTQK